jgi:anti-sigma factor RsiW
MTAPERPIGEDDVQAFVDGRVPPEREAALAAWFDANPQIAARAALERQHRDLLRERLAPLAAEPVPARLRVATIRTARRRARARWMPAAAAVLIFAAGLAGGWIMRGEIPPPREAPVARVADEGFAAYRTYVSEVAHPVEVDAKQEAHLVQWLSRRLGRPLKAPDLSGYGYRLMGGRLLPAGQGVGAQFMYDDQAGRRLTLYVRAGESGETAFRFRQEGAVSTFYWIDQGFGFAVTAAADRSELLAASEAVYRQMEGLATDAAGH